MSQISQPSPSGVIVTVTVVVNLESEPVSSSCGLQVPQVKNLMLLAQGVHAPSGLSVCRKNAVELELAKCKVDMMSLNSQLLDAIQQKLNLSQQLEAWQVSGGKTRLQESGNSGQQCKEFGIGGSDVRG